MKYVFCILMVYIFLGSLTGQESTPAHNTLRLKKFVAPVYPAMAKQARVMGKTSADIEIRTDGTVGSVKITMAYPMFFASVDAALKQWVFEPTSQATTLSVHVNFWLDGCDQKNSLADGETSIVADLPGTVDVKTCIKPIITNSDSSK